MKPSTHFLFSIILAIVLYPFFHWAALIVFAGGVFIDADHYLWYCYKYRKYNFLECYRHFSSHAEKRDFREDYGILLICHTIEFLAVAIVLSFYYEYAMMFAFGLALHYVLDLIFLLSVPKRLVTDHSIIHWIMKNKK